MPLPLRPQNNDAEMGQPLVLCAGPGCLISSSAVGSVMAIKRREVEIADVGRWATVAAAAIIVGR